MNRLLPGPVLLGGGPGGALAELLAGAGRGGAHHRFGLRTLGCAGVRRHRPVGRRSELAEVRAFLAGPVRRLAPSGRVLLIGRLPDGADPVVDAARQAVTGIVRSLAKELRAGATANLVQLAADAGILPMPRRGAVLPVRPVGLRGRPAGARWAPAPGRPGDWDQPLAGKVALVTGAARGIGAAIA